MYMHEERKEYNSFFHEKPKKWQRQNKNAQRGFAATNER
jgi:hypothetical protein